MENAFLAKPNHPFPPWDQKHASHLQRQPFFGMSRNNSPQITVAREDSCVTNNGCKKSNATHLVQVKLHQYIAIPVRSSAVFFHGVSYCCSVFSEQYSRPFNKRAINRLAFIIQCKAYSAKRKKSDRYFRSQ